MRCVWILCIAALAGCTEEQGQPGQEFYANYCISCHGANAQGDGPLAADLPVPPANLTRLSAQNGGVFPYSRVMAQIHGYPGRFEVMPEFSSLLQGPTVAWRDENGTVLKTPKALIDLAEYLASIQTQ